MRQPRIFARLLHPFLAEESPRALAITPAPRTLHDVGDELDRLAEEAEAQRQTALTRAAQDTAAGGGGGAMGLSEVALTEARRKIWKLERASLQARLEDEIVTLHAQLGTGISRERLARLRRLVEAHGISGSATSRPSVEDQIESSVPDALSQQSGAEAWERLNGLMVKAAITWPTPDGLDHSRTGEELAVAVAQHYDEVRRDFVEVPFPRLAGLIAGDIAAWAYSYPRPGGYLWKKTALCSVGAGLHAQLFAAALEIWMWRPLELEARLLAAFEEGLRESRETLRSGNGSLLSALDVASRVVELCGTVAPELVWEYVEPRLSWEGSGPTVMDLADGLTRIDPVCGMALTAERVRAQIVLDGAPYFFCQPSCLDAFRLAPMRYLSA